LPRFITNNSEIKINKVRWQRLNSFITVCYFRHKTPEERHFLRCVYYSQSVSVLLTDFYCLVFPDSCLFMNLNTKRWWLVKRVGGRTCWKFNQSHFVWMATSLIWGCNWSLCCNKNIFVKIYTKITLKTRCSFKSKTSR